MNDTSLFFLDSKKEELLKEYNLHSEKLAEFRRTIRTADDPTALGKQLYSAIIKKSFNDNDGSVASLILQGADVNYKNDKGNFPLYICARKGYLLTFVLLLQAGADVNLSNNYFTTALMAAARHGHSEMVKILLAMGADVNARCLDGDTAIMSAKRHSEKECFDILLRAQAHLNNRNLQNESILEIPGDVGFDLSFLEARESVVLPQTTAKDVHKLLDEAYQKVMRMKGV